MVDNKKTMTQEDLNGILENRKQSVFEHKDLSGLNFSGANLSGANFRNADLTGAILSGTDLQGANFTDADLSGADLSGADLTDAILYRSCLEDANLSRAYFGGTILSGADLEGAKLDEAEGLEDAVGLAPVCPPTGSFVGWKKAQLEDGTRVLLKLFIPDSAKRVSGTTRACRCDKATVLSIRDLDGKFLKEMTAYSLYKMEFAYRTHREVKADGFDEDKFKVIDAKGIYFYMSKEEARNVV